MADIPRGKKISRRVSLIEISATKEMPILACKVGGCVSLGQGVPSFRTPSFIADAVAEGLRSDPAIGKYSLQPGMPELRQAIADHLWADKGARFDPETEIAVTVGAMEGLLDVMLTVVDRGDEVIVPSPAYASHIEQIQLAEGTPVFVPLREEDWGVDVKAVEKSLSPRTVALILCNPGNPTGAVYDDDDVRALCRLALEHELVIIADETYDYLVYDRPAPLSPLSIPEARDHVIGVNSFSKKYALTGWRVGWVAASRVWMDSILKAHDAAAICAPTPSQYAALAALGGPKEPIAEMRDALKRRRDICCERLDGLKDYFDYVRPQGAFYVMARYLFTDEPSRDVAIRILREAKVITVPGGAFGPGGEGRLRLSFGGEEQELNEAFDRLERWLKRAF